MDGTLLNAWASHKSFKPKDGPPPPSDPSACCNAEVQWQGQRRSNDTLASTTAPEARLYRKSHNSAATLCYSGHLLMEHRNALIVDAELTTADGYAEPGHRHGDARPASDVGTPPDGRWDKGYLTPAEYESSKIHQHKAADAG